MPTIPPVSTTTAGVPTTTTKAGTLGKDDFLKLLVGQLKNQDPMNPTNDTEFIGQMAQFSTLEQITNMANAQQATTTQQTQAGAVALLGKNVTYPGPDGAPLSGTVEEVQWNGGSPTLTVAGVAGITPNSVTAVR